MQVVYVDFLHHNDGYHLDGGVTDDAICQHRWRRLATYLASWYATPSGVVGGQFTAILAAEWRGVLRRTWNSDRPLVFVHVFLKKTLGVRRAREIRAQITSRMDLWERGFHADLVGYAEVEGAYMKGISTNGVEEEDETVA